MDELFPTLNVPVTLERKSTVGQALQRMRDHNVRALPIVADNKIEFVGMVDVADIAAYFAAAAAKDGEEVPPQILDANVTDIMSALLLFPSTPPSSFLSHHLLLSLLRLIAA